MPWMCGYSGKVGPPEAIKTQVFETFSSYLAAGPMIRRSLSVGKSPAIVLAEVTAFPGAKQGDQVNLITQRRRNCRTIHGQKTGLTTLDYVASKEGHRVYDRFDRVNIRLRVLLGD
jgi:hypothetical protein